MNTKFIILAALIAATMSFAVSLTADEQPSCSNEASSTSDFLKSIVGEWVGTCEQTNNGEQVDKKYFHAAVKQQSSNIYEAKFEYFRLDKPNGPLIQAGGSAIVTTIATDGTATNKITGSGSGMVDNKLMDHKYDLQEVIKATVDGSMEGNGTGSISISGLPLGLGKNGKIVDEKTTWSLSNDTLTVRQTIKAEFRMLFLGKTFMVNNSYTAKRGTDVKAVIPKSSEAAPKTPCGSAK